MMKNLFWNWLFTLTSPAWILPAIVVQVFRSHDMRAALVRGKVRFFE